MSSEEIAGIHQRQIEKYGRRDRQDSDSTITENSAVSVAAELDAGDLMSITVSLEDPEFQWEEIRSARDQESKLAAIERRQQQLESSQRNLILLLESVGAEIIERRWLTNDVQVRVPAGLVSTIVDLQGVRALHLDTEVGGPDAFYSSLESRNGMRTANLIANGYNGRWYSRLGSSVRQRIGILEWSNSNSIMNFGHVAFKDTATGYLQVGPPRNCRSGSCVTDLASPRTHSHSTEVAAIATGSIEEGQDPAITTPTERIKRSGHSPEAEVFPYILDSCGDLVAAINDAVSFSQVDVINMSFSLKYNCDRKYDCSNLNQTIRNATNAGVLFVGSAGNEGQPNTQPIVCRVGYPKWRPEVVAVGALETNTSFPSVSNKPYWQLPRADWSSQGGMIVRLRDGTTAYSGTVDLMAPGVVELVPTAGGATSYSGVIVGTSFASPAVAGAAANLRHALNYLFGQGVYGWHNGNDARNLLTNLLLLGSDGPNDEFIRVGYGPSADLGYGHVQMHWPHSPWDMTAPFGWGFHSVTLTQGQTAEWDVGAPGAEPPGVKIWKAAATIFESDLNNLSEFFIQVRDFCPPSGYSSPWIVEEQINGDLRQGLRLLDLGMWGIVGHCLKVRVGVLQAPSGGVTIRTADYFDGASWFIH